MIYKILKEDIQLIRHQLAKELDNFNFKNILITGGCGFIGYYLLKTIDVKSINVTLIDNLSSHNTSNKFIKNFQFLNVTFANNDLSKKISKNILKKKFDLIIHLAGIPSPIYYMASPLKTVDIAVNGTRSLLEISKKNKAKFIFFSSSEIYGDPSKKNVPTPESYRGNVSSMGPRACYDESKRLAETLCYTYNKVFNLNCNIIRPFNFFGPGMDSLDYRVIPSFVFKALKNKDINVYGDGKQTRTFCYISDAITGIIKVITRGRPGHAYNIGSKSSEEISMIDLAKKIKIFLDSKSKIKKIKHPKTYPTDDPKRRAPDLSKASKDLNYLDNCNTETGVKKFCSWALNNY